MCAGTIHICMYRAGMGSSVNIAAGSIFPAYCQWVKIIYTDQHMWVPTNEMITTIAYNNSSTKQ